LETYCVASFPSVSHALRFEKLMNSLQKPIKLIPVPRIISSSCGIAARFPQEELDKITAHVVSGEVEVENIYLFVCENRRAQVTSCPGPWTEEKL
jgi:hypothetical protein